MAWLRNMPASQLASRTVPSPSKRKSSHRRAQYMACLAARDYRPPDGYSHQQQLKESSVELVQARYPELLDLVLKGDLVVIISDPNYHDRRADGYQEPEEVFLLGTVHLSRKSVADVQRLVLAVQPQSVVVELCRSRSALMYPEGAGASSLGSGTASGGGSGGGSSDASGWGAADPDERAPDGQREHQRRQRQEKGHSAAAGRSSVSSEGSSPPNAAAPSEGPHGFGGLLGHGLLGQSPAAVSSQNLMGLSGPGLLPAFQRTLQLGGRSALLLRLLLGALTSRVGAQEAPGAGGRMLGAEFMAARLAAEATGALIVLGDRPIEITLRRAWHALSWRRRLQLAGQLLQGALSHQQARLAFQVLLDDETIERLKEDDAVSLVFSQLGAEFPEMMAPLVFERDTYLAWSLKRSKAVNGAKRVVGVVGKGHLRGVCYALTLNSGALRFKDLVDSGGGGRRQGGGMLQQAALEAAVVGALLWAWTSWQAP